MIKAMILAAGHGTRMRPLSHLVPKPLLPIEGRPLLWWSLRHLKTCGVSHCVVNAHHLGTQVNQWVDAHTPPPGPSARDHELPPTRVLIEREILGTAGGIANAAVYLDSDPVIVWNVDQLFRPRFGRARDVHRQGRFLATLLLVRNPHLAQIRIEGTRVKEILPRPDPTDRTLWGFTGTYLLSAEAVTRIPRTGYHDMSPLLRRWCAEGKVGAFVVDDVPWREVGTPETYLETCRDLHGELREPLLGRVEHQVRSVEGFGFIEEGAQVAPGAEIQDSIILAGARVEANARLSRVILGPGSWGAGSMDRVVVANGESRRLSVFNRAEEQGIADVLDGLDIKPRVRQRSVLEDDPLPETLSLRMITSGGSTRQIARGALAGATFIVVHNPQESTLPLALPTAGAATAPQIYPRRADQGAPDENESFVYVASYLRALNVRVPEVRFFDREKGLILQEDLGAVSLYDYLRQPGITDRDRERVYTEAVCVLHQMHQRNKETFDPARVMSPAYDTNFVLQYESGYFHREMLEEALKLPVPWSRLEPEYRRAATECLEDCAPGFMHRDFQSRNLMMTPQGMAVIDFQGARMGPAEYDLASLLLDPYVALPSALRDVLVERYFTLTNQASGERRRSALRRYRMCGINRMLQVLGAFAYLGVKLQKSGFVEHSPTAVNHLRELAAPEFKGLVSMTGRMTSMVMALAPPSEPVANRSAGG
ncbi:MAG: phosphotransferase [Candidatus Eisenbacteria bacterium]|nr:phosphotransferase [Candidatus Eisenbacteria bacterium]